MSTELDRKRLYNRLKFNYFTSTEARKIAYARVNDSDKNYQDINNQGYRDLVNKAIKSRRNFVLNLKSLGYNDNQIVKSINSFYRSNNDESPMSWLRLEYMLPVSSSSSSYSNAVKLRALDIKKKVRNWSKQTVNIPYKAHNVRIREKHPVLNAVNQESGIVTKKNN